MSILEYFERRRKAQLIGVAIAVIGVIVVQWQRTADSQSIARASRDAVRSLVTGSPGYAANQAWFDDQYEAIHATAYETAFGRGPKDPQRRSYKVIVLDEMLIECTNAGLDADAEYFRSLLLDIAQSRR